MASLAVKNRELILERIAKGDYLTEIAHDIGYKYHTGIVNQLADDPDYQAALKFGVRAKLAARERELEVADEAVTVTRARELLAHARWMAKAHDPKTFGDNQRITMDVSVDLGGKLRRSKERIIDAVVLPAIELNAQATDSKDNSYNAE